ncbi:MAG: hypothetical protein K2X38_10220 [Gemmataceae bacterium]|nr:hypothetical protein [Gemmataceae bacterium]
MFVDLWGWFHAYHHAALKQGDAERSRFVPMFHEFWTHVEKDPPQALASVNACMQHARALGEPCWWLFFAYWRIEVYLFYLKTLQGGLDAAVEMMTEARKPEYRHCPAQGRAHRVFIDAYYLIDPTGYEDRIRETIDYVEREVAVDDDSWFILLERRAGLVYPYDRWDEYERLMWQYLAASERSTFRQIHGTSTLGFLRYREGKFDEALQLFAASEEHARANDRKSGIANALMWQSLVSLRIGDTPAATRQHRMAQAQHGKIGMTASDFFVHADAEYREMTGKADEALELFDGQIATKETSGAIHDECFLHLMRLRLAGRMSLPMPERIAETRNAGRKLLKPDWFLAKLARIESGDYSEYPWTK